MPGVTTNRIILPALGIAGLATLSLLYALRPQAYHAVLTAWMLHPFTHPFMDWEWIPSAVKCWQQGINVYVDNTCYAPVPHGRHMYSPLWLRATFLPLGNGWVAPFGLGLATLFFLSLALLPPPRGRRHFSLMLLCAGSSVSAFALERGNADVIMYLLMVGGVFLWIRGTLPRLAAYMLFMLAGLLKYYPLVLMLTALRERVPVFVMVFLASSAAFAGFLHVYHSELAMALHSIPGGSYFTDLFGAVNLPLGISVLGRRALQAADLHGEALTVFVAGTLPAMLFVLLVAESARRAIRFANYHGVRAAFARLPALDAGMMVAGSTVICGCFFSGQSVGYRAIFLLPVIPGLLQLANLLPDAHAASRLRGTCWAIVFVMWGLTFEYLIVLFGLSDRFDGDASTIGVLHWFAHELAWWWIIGVLLAVIGNFVTTSTMWRTLFPGAPEGGPRRIETTQAVADKPAGSG